MAILESPSACIAAEEGVIAKAVLMPGDPLRAKFVAEHYLENPVCFNTVRNMLGYTGTYKGRKLSVMGHGMGVPSAGLYAHELYNFYGVDTIIRIGSAGGIGEDVKVRDVVLAMGASTNSHFADQTSIKHWISPILALLLSYRKTPAIGRRFSCYLHQHCFRREKFTQKINRTKPSGLFYIIYCRQSDDAGRYMQWNAE